MSLFRQQRVLLVLTASICMSLWCATALAQGSATLSWTAPTQNTDGSDLTDLAGYDVHWGTTSGQYEQSVTLESPGATGYVVENLTPGEWFFAVRAFNSSGVRSDYSNEATKTIPEPVPLPPTNLQVVEGAETAYTLQRSENRMALVPVGTVAPGTACDGNQSVRDANGITAYVVPREAVEWAGSTETTVALARCQGG